MLALLLLLSSTAASLTNTNTTPSLTHSPTPPLCTGDWTTTPPPRYFPTHTLTHSPRPVPHIDLLCPAETIMHNCHFHSLTRAHTLHTRHFRLHTHSPCTPYSPTRFLRSLHNTSIVLLGDSVMMQIFSSLACSLAHATTHSLNIDWKFHQGGTNEVSNKVFNNITCPYNAYHCHFLRATITFPEYHVSIAYGGLTRQHSATDMLAHYKLRPQDIMLFNFGLHMNTAGYFQYTLDLFVKSLRKLPAASKRPHLFYMETTPTHFDVPSEQVGYYVKGIKKTACAPVNISSVEEYRKIAYRTHLDSLEALRDNITVIRVVDALLSQYDSHVDGDSEAVHFSLADCVHFCSDSGVFRFLQTTFLNHFVMAKNGSIQT